MEITKILSKVKKNVSKSRYDHTVRVMKTAIKLAEIHNINQQQVEIASALHDYSKCESEDDLKNYIIDHHIDADLLNYNQELWHSHVGAHYAQYTLGIDDRSILNAIKYHTTGRENMDQVELIVFIADFIEPERKIAGIDKIRKMAEQDLHEAALLIFKASIPYLVSLEAVVYPGTVDAYNYLIKLKGDH